MEIKFEKTKIKSFEIERLANKLVNGLKHQVVLWYNQNVYFDIESSQLTSNLRIIKVFSDLSDEETLNLDTSKINDDVIKRFIKKSTARIEFTDEFLSKYDQRKIYIVPSSFLDCSNCPPNFAKVAKSSKLIVSSDGEYEQYEDVVTSLIFNDYEHQKKKQEEFNNEFADFLNKNTTHNQKT